ncbi:MAG: hypothetical protein LN568_02275 [Rickettsia endosymbiont of Pseudomimeciton antennatum]|nr:hypothetical protein [Rickettsia endosymbiont of Pseudomimeciton antennatum]
MILLVSKISFNLIIASLVVVLLTICLTIDSNASISLIGDIFSSWSLLITEGKFVFT